MSKFSGGSVLSLMVDSQIECMTRCILELCTAIEMSTDGTVCRVYRGGHQYRVPLPAQAVADNNYNLIQSQREYAC